MLQATTLKERSKLPLLAACMLVLTTGCRGRAQKEVYDAQMAHEIRVLEDQLYEADYQNRILVDKIESLKLKGAPPFSTSNPNSGTGSPLLPDPVRDSGIQSRPRLPSQLNDPLLDAIDDLDAMIDAGKEEPLKPAPPSIQNLDLPTGSEGDSNAPGSPMPKEPPKKNPRDDKRLGFLPPSVSSPLSTPPLQPAPGGPEPPGKNSLVAPAIIQGELLPPPGKEPADPLPPGQIVLPGSANLSVPQTIKLHPSLSGGVEQDGRLEEMILVVNVLDQRGRPIELADYDVRADLSVVLFDGEREPSDSNRLGRWDFKPEEVNRLIKEDPISGFHIPIEWKGLRPESSVVQAHVRLRAEEDEMRCNDTVRVLKQNALTKWAPRGNSLDTDSLR